MFVVSGRRFYRISQTVILQKARRKMRHLCVSMSGRYPRDHFRIPVQLLLGLGCCPFNTRGSIDTRLLKLNISTFTKKNRRNRSIAPTPIVLDFQYLYHNRPNKYQKKMKFVAALTTLLAGSAAAFAPAPPAFSKSHNGIATVSFRIVAHDFCSTRIWHRRRVEVDLNLTPSRLLSLI
jgi:hypothetical protein